MLSVVLGLILASAQETKAVVAEDVATLKEGQNSQLRINKLSEETQVLLQKYRQTLKQIENTRIYVDQLRQIIDSQEREKVSVAEQIETLKETNKGMLPLIVSMVGNIEEFVALDLPFLAEERGRRLAKLRALLKQADVSTSEKFRRVLEAYQIENEYGRTIEAYRGLEKAGGREVTVDYLRIGRIALLYQTLDGSQSALWDPAKKSWQKLPGSYRKSVASALKMAQKQSAPQLVKIPVFAAGAQ